MRLLRRFSPFVLALAVCAATLATSPERAEAATRSCTTSPYAYAGLMGHLPVAGVRATLTALTAPNVVNGHVAAWVGVGGTSAGPNGEEQWIQIGLSGFKGGLSQLYYEITRPGAGTTYTPIVEDVKPGESYAVAVVEVPNQPNVWRVEVDGRPVSPNVSLAGSHGKWQAVATSESWNGGMAGCNGYSYRFRNVAARHAGAWRTLSTGAVLSDKGYGLTGRTASGFVAGSL